MFSRDIRKYTKKALEKRGVEVRLGELVSSIEPTRVTLESGEVLKAHTLVWGAGLQANPLATSLGLELQKANRIAVGPDLSLPDHPEAFAVGDIAWITEGEDGEALPQLGSVAMQSGEHAGETIRRRIEDKQSEPFSYRDKGTMATIGRGAAVIQMPGGRDHEGKDGVPGVGSRAPRAPVLGRGPCAGNDGLGLGRFHTQAAGSHHGAHTQQ